MNIDDYIHVMTNEGTYKLCKDEADKSNDTNVKNLLPTDDMHKKIKSLFGNDLDGSKFINVFKKEDGKTEMCRISSDNSQVLKCKIMGE